MRIRKAYANRDCGKIVVILCLILLLLGILAEVVYQESHGEKRATIELMLKKSMEPVGKTMYIWGGGWNACDDASGEESMQLGIRPQWECFAKMQDENYDFREYEFQREKGLDCSGYVGWVLYNTFETRGGNEGYVTTSTDMAESLAERGWGCLLENPKEFLPGDIVSMEGHVWISLGTCQDGSVLLVHSSPPGVSVCGTSMPVSRMENVEAGEVNTSVAIQLATKYMETYHSVWQEKYPNRKVALSYLENISVFRWGKNVMCDAEEFQRKSAEEIMGILSPDM